MSPATFRKSFIPLKKKSPQLMSKASCFACWSNYAISTVVTFIRDICMDTGGVCFLCKTSNKARKGICHCLIVDN